MLQASHVSGITQHLSFYDWPASRSVTSSRFAHAVGPSFLRPSHIPLCGWIIFVYPFTSLWTRGLLPSTCGSLCNPASSFGVLTQKWGCWEFCCFLSNRHTVLARRLLRLSSHRQRVGPPSPRVLVGIADSCPDGREVASRCGSACVSAGRGCGAPSRVPVGRSCIVCAEMSDSGPLLVFESWCLLFVDYF